MKSYIHQVKKNRDTNFGNNYVNLIHVTLTEFGFQVKQEITIQHEQFSTPNKIRNPDLSVTFGKMRIIIESDGKVHGDLENPTESTVRRNADYERTKQQYILINHESIKYIRKILKVSTPSTELVRFLTLYRILEEYSKFLAGEIK